MAQRTLVDNVAQAKADFKGIRDGFGEYFDSIYDEPTSAYGNYPFYTYNRGKDEGIEQGKQAQYDAMCDAFQNSGKRTIYTNGFCYGAYTEETIPLKYDMYPTDLKYAFQGMSTILNFEKAINDRGIKFDTSNCTAFNYAFASSGVTHVPTLDLTKGTTLDAIFGWNSNLISVRKVILKDDGSQKLSYFAQGSSNLEEIYFEGCIGQSVSFQWSKKLKRNPILSILQSLKATVSGITVTLPSKCIDKATDTLALIQGDTELNTAYTNALTKGYTITFV